LTGECRISELARMLAGHADSSSAREHARELLEASQPGRPSPSKTLIEPSPSNNTRPYFAVPSGIFNVIPSLLQTPTIPCGENTFKTRVRLPLWPLNTDNGEL